MESLISIIIVLVVLGLVYYLVTLLPIPEPFRTIIYVVIILALIIWLLSFIGVVPRLRLA
jgi:ABC-type siderophore export system fused ATPase/permease subunit